VFYAHSAETGYSPWDTITVGPRIGYNARLTRDLSIWPAISVAYGLSAQGQARLKDISASAYVPLVFEPAPHLFGGIGPFFTSSWSATQGSGFGDNARDYGLLVMLGGWVG
jgi:hypothetical protein